MDLGEGVSGPEAKKSQKSLEKSLPGPGPKSPEKVSKKVRKVKKKSENGFLETFRSFFETFSGLLGPRAGRLFRDFFETFWLRAPRLLLPGPRNLNPKHQNHLFWELSLFLKFSLKSPNLVDFWSWKRLFYWV